MTNGPDDQGQELPPPSSPPPPSGGGGRSRFARNDPDQPGPLRPQQQRPQGPDPRARQAPPPGSGDNPFLLPNERDRLPAYGAAAMPVIPLALMVLAIVVGAALFYMSQEDKDSGGISPQQASSNVILHLDGVDITESAFRREIGVGISKGNIPCASFAGQTADNVAAGLKLGALKMTVPNQSGVEAKKDQKADDASLKLAAQIVLDACPKGAAPAPGTQQNPPAQPTTQPGGAPPPPGGQTPAPAGTQVAPPPGGQPPAGTPRPNTPAPAGGTPPAATPRP